MQKRSSAFTLVFCVLGLYVSFVSWSILQERINTKPYGANPITGELAYFKAPLMINIVQAFFAMLVGFIYSLATTKSNPFSILTNNDRSDSIMFLKSFILIAVTSSISSPIGYESLKHVDYLVYLLAKSCKLIPVMLIHFVCYRTKYPFYKYAVAGLVTMGVATFTLFHSSKSNKISLNDGKTALGISQLVFSMILDGLTNSTQDYLFKRQSSKCITNKMTGACLMCILNLLVCLITVSYTLIFKFDSEIVYTLNFIQKYPQVLKNILAFGLFGSIGQVFVFIILEKFDSLILITATVTRKMLSMIVSVVLFGHYLNFPQWCGVIMVFGAIGYEALVKLNQPKSLSKSKKTQ